MDDTYLSGLTAAVSPALAPVEVDVASEDVTDREALGAWWLNRRHELDETLSTVGAVLLRRGTIFSPQDFQAFADVVCGGLDGYVEGSSERKRTADKVYTSSEYPPQYRISLHNELSYAAGWPARLCFLCLEAASSGGETPLTDSRQMLEVLPTELVGEFRARGVRYTRNLRSVASSGVGLPWEDVFETNSREEVEQYCRQRDVNLAWRRDGGLTTEQVRPAIRRHPLTGEEVWFNQADQFHPTNLGSDAAADMYLMFDEDELPTNATFGDGGRIPEEMLTQIRSVADGLAWRRPWQIGDILVIDNMLVAHGRMPFEGDRAVLVAMG